VGIQGYTDDSKVDQETLENNLIFLGLNAAIDPERPEVADAILLARNAGVDTVL